MLTEQFCTKEQFIKMIGDVVLKPHTISLAAMKLNFERFCFLYRKEILSEAEKMMTLYAQVILESNDKCAQIDRLKHEIESYKRAIETQSKTTQKVHNELIHAEKRIKDLEAELKYFIKEEKKLRKKAKAWEKDTQTPTASN